MLNGVRSLFQFFQVEIFSSEGLCQAVATSVPVVGAAAGHEAVERAELGHYNVVPPFDVPSNQQQPR